MAPRLNSWTVERISASDLRSETAAIVHEVYRGAVKMVAANRPPHGVSRSRVDRECEGADANRLELLCRDLDRIVIEKGALAVAPVLAFLNARYSTVKGEQDGVDDDLANLARAAGELLARVIEAKKDGIQSVELPAIRERAHAVRAVCDQIVQEVETEAASNGTVRAIRRA